MRLTTLTKEGLKHYSQIQQPHELTSQEKDELLFILLEHHKLGVYRAIEHAGIIVVSPME